MQDDANPLDAADRDIALVLAGGVGLGAYQAGAYAQMHEAFVGRIDRLAGSSIGAVNAALVAGSRPTERVETLRRFWMQTDATPLPGLPPFDTGPLRHMTNWMSALQTRSLGRPGVFRLRTLPELMTGALGIYDLSPLRTTLERLVDFDRLNGGDPRVTLVATDLETGDAVLFDTANGDRIGPDHILASCGFLPEFQPVEIGGRLLGDGALVANAPVDVVLGDSRDRPLICFVLDLFARDGSRPASLARAQERRLDLLLANQTEAALAGLQREDRLRRLLASALERLPPELANSPDMEALRAEAARAPATVLYLSYRPVADEADSEKQYDFSAATIGDRWRTGALDMAAALDRLREDGGAIPGLTLARIRR